MMCVILWVVGYAFLWLVVLILTAKVLIRACERDAVWKLVERFDRQIILSSIVVSVLLLTIVGCGQIFDFLATVWKCILVGFSAFSLAFAYPIVRYVDTLLGAIRASS